MSAKIPAKVMNQFVSSIAKAAAEQIDGQQSLEGGKKGRKKAKTTASKKKCSGKSGKKCKK